MAGIDNQASTLFSGDVSKNVIYMVSQGEGIVLGKHMRTETLVSAKPRQLRRAKHAGNPITDRVKQLAPSDFTPFNDSIIVDGRELTVTPTDVYLPIDVEKMKEDFPRFQPSGLNVDLKANPEMLKTAIDLTKEAMMTQINNLDAVGDDTLISPDPLRFYNGLVTLILADADATQVGVPAVLDSSNILDKAFELRNAIDPRLRRDPDLKFICSYADFDLFDVAARKTQTATVITTVVGTKTITYTDGTVINLIPSEGVPKDFMFATVANTKSNSNLVRGVWVSRDFEAVKFFRFSEADMIWNIVIRADVGVQYVTGDDIWYLNNV